MSSKKIVICDDDSGILDMLTMALEIEDYIVIPEQNSLNVYSVIEHERPDLLLLDLWMPVLSGDQVLKTLRSNPNTQSLRVIVMSASTDGPVIASNAGANDYIAKPFDLDQLSTKVNEILNRY